MNVTYYVSVPALVLGFCFGFFASAESPSAPLDQKLPPIQKNIGKKIAEQSKRKTGGYYWDLLQADDFQSKEDLEKYRTRLLFERLRAEEAEKLLKNGAIELTALVRFCLQYNNQILAERSALRAVQGEKLINSSRFLPHIDLIYNQLQYDTGFAGKKTDSVNAAIKVTQKFVEFGQESDSSLLFREAQRRALFGYEETLSRVLQGLRTKFFTILLWQEQIKERQTLLAEYRDRYQKMQALEAVRRVLEVDVLTSRLNVLHEEARINSLEKELYRQKIDLQKYAGLPIGFTDYSLKGEVTPLQLDMETCVNIALRRSTAIAAARAIEYEQQRVSRRVWWAHAPGVALGLKWSNAQNIAGVSIDRNNGTYSVNGFAEQSLKGPDSAMAPQDMFFAADREGWRFDISATLPLFQGFGIYGKHKKEKALLERTSYYVRHSIDSIELSVRKAYQTMLEQKKGFEILKETASISHERLKIQESLKDIGKITDNELETFRNRFFTDQGEYYNAEAGWIFTQEALRYEMRWFDPDTLLRIPIHSAGDSDLIRRVVPVLSGGSLGA